MDDKSFFVQVLGNYPLIRVLDFLITFREYDYPLTEIAENSKVGWTTLHKLWPKLVESGIVIPTRQIGRARLYKLNQGSPVTQELIKLDEKITAEYTEKILAEEQKKPTPAKA